MVQSDGRLYLVFEFVDKDLKKYMEGSDGPLQPELIRSYTDQLLRGQSMFITYTCICLLYMYIYL